MNCEFCGGFVARDAVRTIGGLSVIKVCPVCYAEEQRRTPTSRGLKSDEVRSGGDR